jgi:peptidoglycan-N-acetylglucosamine deacetylase
VLMHDGLGPGARRTGCVETVALVEPLVARLRELGCEPTPLGVAVGEHKVEA